MRLEVSRKAVQEAQMNERAFEGAKRLASALDASLKRAPPFSTRLVKQLLAERNASITSSFSKLNEMDSNSSDDLHVKRVLLI